MQVGHAQNSGEANLAIKQESPASAGIHDDFATGQGGNAEKFWQIKSFIHSATLRFKNSQMKRARKKEKQLATLGLCAARRAVPTTENMDILIGDGFSNTTWTDLMISHMEWPCWKEKNQED